MENQIYESKKDCCGCGACQAICPKNAIDMVEDECGFIYPQIDNSKCINCGLCKKTCVYKKPKQNKDEKEVYYAVSKNKDNLKESASGGVFIELAIEIINNGGLVYGCSMETIESKLYPKHIRVNNLKDLRKLQGSKYVQSECGLIYKNVKKDLIENKIVLFSGTPCQIEGLKSYLQYKEYDNLILVDIICHGVPSKKMFQDYIKEFEIKNNCKVRDFYFRDKKNGWGLFYKIVYKKDEKVFELVQPCYESSFYQLFLDSAIYRENCYECPYACDSRNSDITIGDFWGIKEEHSEIEIDEKDGISCIICNTDKGKKYLKKYGGNIEFHDSKFEKVSRHNHQLNYPSELKTERNKILCVYRECGYKAVEKYYKRKRFVKNKIKRMRDILKNRM